MEKLQINLYSGDVNNNVNNYYGVDEKSLTRLKAELKAELRQKLKSELKIELLGELTRSRGSLRSLGSGLDPSFPSLPLDPLFLIRNFEMKV